MKSKPLHEILQVTKGMLLLQTQNKDVAVPYWRGAPGIAKTALGGKMCRENEMNMLETHYGQTPIEEVSGLPTFHDITINVNGQESTHKGTQWTLPDILTQLYQIAANGRPTVWLLDDFHLAPPGMMQLGYELFTEKKLRGFPIPQNVCFLLAGNLSAKAGSKKNLLSAVANRCAIFPVHLDFNYWKTNYAIPAGMNGKIISFLSYTKYRKFFQEEEQLDRPWASARSWTKFSNILTPLEQMLKVVPHQDVLYYAAAHLGDDASAEFTGYYKIFSQVETDKIFDGLIDINVPSDMSGQYIFTLANVTEFIQRYTSKRNKPEDKAKAVDVMARILIAIAQVKSEIAVTGLKEIVVTEQALKIRDAYFRVKSALTMKDPDMATRLETDIKQI
jgi:hypothetical protein